jgi:hypothetical protein
MQQKQAAGKYQLEWNWFDSGALFSRSGGALKREQREVLDFICDPSEAYELAHDGGQSWKTALKPTQKSFFTHAAVVAQKLRPSSCR